MKCPDCSVDLRMMERQDIEIDCCPRCGGVWLGREELEAIIARATAVAIAPAKGRDDRSGELGYDPGYYVPRRKGGPSRGELSGS